MKAKFYLATVISGLLVASCAGGQSPFSISSDPSRATYQLLSTGETAVSYTVSTGPGVTTATWYPLSNLDDGNLNTAWGPASASPTPSLIFDLAETCNVDAVSTKVSIGQASSTSNERVSLDVYAWVEGAWVLIGDDLTPPETVMTSLDVTDTVTDRIRIDFNTAASGQLLVCAVEITCAAMPTPAPSPTPTPTPSPTPTLTPPPVSNEDCCKVTGGGEVPSLEVPDGAKNPYVSFGFNAQEDPDKGAKGQLQVNDHATGERWHIEVTDIVRCDHDLGLVEFVGDVKLTNTDTAVGSSARVVVVDNGEPGREDTFTFWVDGALEADGDLKGRRPGGGNIQFHKTNCD